MGREIKMKDIIHKKPDAVEYTISVYIDNGVVFYDSVEGPNKAREHSAAIVKDGYRHNPETVEGEEPLFEHYGPHRILKVKITGGLLPSLFHDESRGT